MAIFTNLPVYKDSYTLLLEINRMMPNVSRDCRYSIGKELRKKIMEIIILIYRANRLSKKVFVIAKMRESLLEVQVYIRLMCDMKYISEGKYIRLVEQTTSMSKQMAAWEKSEQNKVTDGKA
jgi:hypothetical protein